MASNFKFLKQCSCMIPETYDGERTKLQAFLKSIEILEEIAEPNQFDLLGKFIKSKLINRASDVIPETVISVSDIKNQLKLKIKYESSDLLMGKISNLRIEKNNLILFLEKLEILSYKLIQSLIEEGLPENIAIRISTDKTTETCRKINRIYLIDLILASSNFNTPQEVISKFLRENSTENKYQNYGYNNRFSIKKLEKVRNYENINYAQKPNGVKNENKNEKEDICKTIINKNIKEEQVEKIKIKNEIENNLNKTRIEYENNIKNEIKNYDHEKLKHRSLEKCKNNNEKCTTEIKNYMSINNEHTYVQFEYKKLCRGLISLIFYVILLTRITSNDVRKMFSKKFNIPIKNEKYLTYISKFLNKNIMYAKKKPNENIPPDISSGLLKNIVLNTLSL